MNWFLIQEIGFYIFLALTIYYVFKKKYDNLMILYFYAMVFATCYKFAFTIWFPTKIVSMGMLVCILRSGATRSSSVKNIATKMTSVFLIMLLTSNLWGMTLPKEYAENFNGVSRMVNQSYTYITAFIILFYGRLLEPGFVKRLYPSYMFAIEICIITAIIHFICLKAGIPFMPILRQNGTFNEGNEVVAQFGSSVVSRIYAFVGEPKNLGFLILPYVLISLMAYNNGFIRKNTRYHVGFLLAGTFALIQTYSSAALMNLAFAIPIILLFFTTKRTFLSNVLLVGIIIVGFSLVTIKLSGGVTSNDPNFIESFYGRTFGRAENELENDRGETLVFNAFKESDGLTPLIGWGVSQYTFHAPGQTIGNALIPLQSGLVLTLADFGACGILYLFFVGFTIWGLLWKSKQMRNYYSLSFAIAALSSFIGSLMFGMLTGCFFYLMLALYAYYDERDYYAQTQ